MIIVKQDKKGIVNFDNVTDIYVDKEEDGNRYFVLYIPVSNLEGIDILGEYATEERAKKVLQEIIKAYRDYRTAECDGYTNVLQETAVYEMPEK